MSVKRLVCGQVRGCVRGDFGSAAEGSEPAQELIALPDRRGELPIGFPVGCGDAFRFHCAAIGIELYREDARRGFQGQEKNAVQVQITVISKGRDRVPRFSVGVV